MSLPAKRGWFLAFVALLLSIAGAPAHAHTDLESTSPTDGQTLKAAPRQVSLTFAESLLKGGQRLVAQNAAGDKIELSATVDGTSISAPWPQSEQSGRYKVSYRVVAEDGHPLEGAITFTVDAPAASASPVSAPSPEPTVQETSTGSAMNLWLPALLVIAALVAGFFIWRSRAD